MLYSLLKKSVARFRLDQWIENTSDKLLYKQSSSKTWTDFKSITYCCILKIWTFLDPCILYSKFSLKDNAGPVATMGETPGRVGGFRSCLSWWEPSRWPNSSGTGSMRTCRGALGTGVHWGKAGFDQVLCIFKFFWLEAWMILSLEVYSFILFAFKA